MLGAWDQVGASGSMGGGEDGGCGVRTLGQGPRPEWAPCPELSSASKPRALSPEGHPCPLASSSGRRAVLAGRMWCGGREAGQAEARLF